MIRPGDAPIPPPALSPGTDTAPALIVEDDPLLRLLVEHAVLALGLRSVAAGACADDPPPGLVRPGAPAAVLVGLDRPGLYCASTGWESAVRDEGVLRVGYAARAGLLAVHRVHGCCDAYLELTVEPGGAVFAHPPGGTAIERAGLTSREADVVLLLAAGLTTPAVADRLCVSPATARSHCRSVLRKLGVADRRRLRELVWEQPAGGAGGGCGRVRPARCAARPGCQPSSSNTRPVSSLG